MQLPQFRNFLSLTLLQGMRLAAPLLIIPWLGRVLDPETFGILMYLSLVPPLVALVLDWGFTLGGAADVARRREDPAFLRLVLGRVTSGRLILACGCLLAAVALGPFIPYASQHVWPFFLAILAGVARGSSPLWFYQGLGTGLEKLALWDALATLLALALTLLFVRSSAMWPWYFAFFAICKITPHIILTLSLWRQYRPVFGLFSGMAALRQYARIFQGAFFLESYPYGAQLTFGFFLTATDVGVVVAVNKILKALAGVGLPIIQTVFPEVCRLHDCNESHARHLLRRCLAIMAGGMGVAAVIGNLWAPELLTVALGTSYTGFGWVLAIMVWAAPLRCVANVLGSLILIPYGHAREQAQVAMLGALLAIPTAAALGWLLQLTGAAWTPVVIELALCAGYGLNIWRTCPQALFYRVK